MSRRFALILLLLVTLTGILSRIPHFSLKDVRASVLPSDMPVVYVSPQNVSAFPGETVTISVNVFNLSNNFHSSNETWVVGGPLPPLVPAGGRYNYSLGNLYGFYIVFSWDPTVLEYVSHSVRVPVETYSDGILHEPIIDVQDEVDAAAGTYSIAKSSQSPAAAFNSPGADATVFNMTFEVKKRGKCTLSIDEAELAVDRRMPNLFYEIPHWITSGEFQALEPLTRIEGLEAGVLVNGELHEPVISGETITVDVSMRNPGEIMDRYNLSLYDETGLLTKWENKTLGANESKAFSYIIAGLDIGTHTVTASATILHRNETFTDEYSKTLKVIGTPVLSIEILGPEERPIRGYIGFNASGTVHEDPDGHILNYEWSLLAPGELHPRFIYSGTIIYHYFSPSAKEGTWRVRLEVRDDYGVEYDPLRPATDPYQKEVQIEVGELPSILIVSPENRSYPEKTLPLSFVLSELTSWTGYSLDNQANVTITGNSTLAGLSEGTHKIKVYANDTSGYMGSSGIHFTVLDTTSPIISVTSPQNQTYGTNEVNLTFSLGEPVSWTVYSLDGEANITVLSGSSVLSGLSEGSHRVRVFAEDLNGNVGSSETIYFTIHTPLFPMEILAVIAVIAVAGVAALIIFAKRKKVPT